MDFNLRKEDELELVHEGTETRLFRLNDDGSGNTYVVKIARNASPFSRQAELLGNELHISRNFDHPGLRRGIRSGNSDGRPYILLEYVDGSKLHEYCRKFQPDLSGKLQIAVRIAGDLVELHRLNIIYKNLNKDHVLVTDEGRCVLVDFTIAVECTSTYIPEQQERVEGNLAYISPEQTGRTNRMVDYRTDLYAFGVLLYELLSGRLPFEKKTPAELIHEHLASPPLNLSSICPEVPQVLSNIVMKLMQKNPEERYQSACGVIRDLKRCQKQLDEHGSIDEFELGRDDVSDRLLRAQGVTGREEELALLEHSFEHAVSGKSEVVIVHGAAGTGKTLLATQLKKYAQQGECFFVSGSYDQYQRHIPFSGLNQALSALVSTIFRLDPACFEILKEQLRHEVPDAEDVLLAVFPSLQPFFPATETGASAVGSGAQQELLLHAVCTLIALVAHECRPLVFFLDNLQWADPHTVELITMLAREGGRYPFLCIGACDGELPDSDTGRAMSVVDLCRDMRIKCIELKNFTTDDLLVLIKNILHRSDDETRGLADAVYDKTGGNPQLVLEFIQVLYRNGILWFDFVSKQWQWNIQSLQEQANMDDVVASVGVKLDKLGSSSLEVLMCASCIGNEFTLDVLAALRDKSVTQVREAIKEAENDFLVLPRGDSFCHTIIDTTLVGPYHGRIRQVAYSRLSSREKRATHLKLGRWYLDKFSREECDRRIFDIVDQLNEGFTLISESQEFRRLAQLNLAAGKKALRSGNYLAAVRYFNMGVGFLPHDRWEKEPELSLDFFKEIIEAEYLNRNFSRVLTLVAELEKYGVTEEADRKARKYRILALAAQGHHKEAFGAALDTLESLGVLKSDEVPGNIPSIPAAPVELDMTTLIKASHLLSREIQLEQLLKTFIQIVMENAGAEKGVLIIEQKGRMNILCRAHKGAGAEFISNGPFYRESTDVPHLVVDTVINLRKPVVLSDAQHDPEFSIDPYITGKRVLSVLCMPVIHQATLVGALYLENSLTADVFSKDQLQMLSVLVSQGAISIEIAKLYASLEEKVQELNLAHNALSDSRNWLVRILNALPEPVFVKDSEHRWVLLNDAFYAFMGYSQKEMIGKSDYDFYPKDEADIFWEKDEEVFRSGKDNINEEPFTDAQGKLHTIITKKTLYIDERGERYIVGIIRDITERVNLEAKLRQTAKMESVGRLAGGVAHDFNNMLSVIIGHTDLALEEVDRSSPLYDVLSEIKKAGERSADLTRQLLAFARKQTVAPKVLDINKTVVGMMSMLKRLIGEDIDLAWVPGSDVWHVNVDPTQIDQLLANLCVNARDAINDVGKITIETANLVFDDSFCEDHPGIKAGEYVLMAVSDNGCGMSAETQANIFEPFYTTKGEGKGTGLGLATVYGIVRQNSGFINVYSEPGEGTTFKIYLPRYLSDQEKEQDKPEEQPIEEGHETVLLVEDEPAILKMTDYMLKKMGYRVVTAGTPDEALAQVEKYAGEIDLLMTDVVMPEMNGKDLARKIISMQPKLKSIFMSGYTASVIAHHGVLDEGVNFIQKPFTAKQLSVKIREALDSEIS